MTPIRDAFNQTGLKRFRGEWTGEERALLDNWPTTAALVDFSPSERAAFDRCTAIVAFLTQELAAGQAVAVTTDAHHRRSDVPTEYWRDSAHDEQWQDGAENLTEYLTDRGTSRFIRFPAVKTTVGVADKEASQQPKPTRRRGPKPKADWETYKVMFFELCGDRGLPDDSGNDWGSIVAAIGWLQDVAGNDPGSEYHEKAKAVPFETARDHVNEWIDDYRATNGGN